MQPGPHCSHPLHFISFYHYYHSQKLKIHQKSSCQRLKAVLLIFQYLIKWKSNTKNQHPQQQKWQSSCWGILTLQYWDVIRCILELKTLTYINDLKLLFCFFVFLNITWNKTLRISNVRPSFFLWKQAKNKSNNV